MDWYLLIVYILYGQASICFLTALNIKADLSKYASTPQKMPPHKLHSSFTVTTADRRSICMAPLDLGNCSQHIVQYFYDATINRCKKFFYSGCGGNANRFGSRAQCRQRCARLKTTTPRAKTITSHMKNTHANAYSVTYHRKRSNECSQCDPKYGVCANGRCRCVKGFTGDGKKCEDINECTEDVKRCSANAFCINTIGSFRCECQLGYAGSGWNCTKSSDICSQKFDRRYEAQCSQSGEWEIRYYFDAASSSCRRFWYGGCTSANQNIFADAQSCEALCVHRADTDLDFQIVTADGVTTLQSDTADICLDVFDVILLRPCVTLAWQPRFFYNQTASRCQMFWYDTSCESTGLTRNIFGYLSTCRRLCESSRTASDHRVRHRPKQKGKGIGKITAMFARDKQTLTTPTFHSAHITPASMAVTKSSAIPRFIVNAKLTDYPTTTKTISQDQQLTETSQRMRQYPNSSTLEKTSTLSPRPPFRLGKISVTFSEYKASDKVKSFIGTVEPTLMTPSSVRTGSGTSETIHPNQIDENVIYPVLGISEPSVSPSRAGPTFGDVKSNAISEGHSAASKEAAALEPSRAPVRANLDDTEVAKLDIGQQFSLQFATTLAVAVECLDQFDVNLTQSCGYGEWQSRYYFNRDTRKCQMYWNDGCRSLSRNNFENLAICEWKCEGTHPKPQSSEQKMLKIVNSNPTDINNLVVVSPNNRQETKFTVLLQSMHNFTIDL